MKRSLNESEINSKIIRNKRYFKVKYLIFKNRICKYNTVKCPSQITITNIFKDNVIKHYFCNNIILQLNINLYIFQNEENYSHL